MIVAGKNGKISLPNLKALLKKSIRRSSVKRRERNEKNEAAIDDSVWIFYGDGFR